MEEKRVLTRQEAADYMSVGVCTLDKMIRRRDNPLPHVIMGSKRVLIPKNLLDKWIDNEAERNTYGEGRGGSID